MIRRLHGCAVLAGVLALAPALSGRQTDAASTFRVFLADGRTLASYGESAVVGDRLVFTLPIGDVAARFDLQLMSLPLASIDMARTTHYAESVRAAHYAATRGESDYAEITTEVSRSLDQLQGIADPKRRLAVAESARQRLIDWSNANYGYRATDIQELAGLFDEVIAELRVAAGESRISLALVSRPVAAQVEPIQASPLSLRDSIAMALSAAAITDNRDDRAAILRTALAATADAPGVDDLRADISRRLDDDVAADRAYAALSVDVLTRADAAMRRGDVRAVDALRAELTDRDRALGSRRPDDVRGLMDKIEAKLEATRAHRLALDHYELVRPSLLAYERKVRPLLAAIDGLKSVFDAIRDMSGPGFEWLIRADTRLKRAQADFERVQPPDDLQGVHATFVSALRMAMTACARRRQAIIAPNMSVAREGSAAASGALLLFGQARESLVAQLYPPKLQ